MIDPRAAINTTPFAWDNGVPTPGRIPAEIHETAEVYQFANVQAGNARATTIGARSKIDAFVHVGHDVQIGEDVTVVAHAVLCGHVTIEDNAYIGAGALVKQRVRIGRNALVGMGAVVVGDVPPNCIVVGNPARFLRYRFPNEPKTRNAAWNEEAKEWR
jgi:acyl-[acyl carrier protein]--UDP-N-acetylglucosamine O-acyltransferase